MSPATRALRPMRCHLQNAKAKMKLSGARSREPPCRGRAGSRGAPARAPAQKPQGLLLSQSWRRAPGWMGWGSSPDFLGTAFSPQWPSRLWQPEGHLPTRGQSFWHLRGPAGLKVKVVKDRWAGEGREHLPCSPWKALALKGPSVRGPLLFFS